MIENALTIGSILKGATTYTIEKQLHQGGFGMTYLAKARIMVGNIPQVAMFSIKTNSCSSRRSKTFVRRLRYFIL